MARKKTTAKDRRAAKDRPWEPTPEMLEQYADWTRGLTLRQIAEKIEVSKSAVHQNVHKVRAWLMPRYMEQIREIKAEHHDRLMAIYHEAMDAWERSKQDAVENRAGVSGDNEVDITVTKGQCGDSQYLDKAMASLDRIRKSWGADEPIEVRHSGEVRVAGMSKDAARREMFNRMQAMLGADQN